jgi:hypothetical protein
MGLSVLQTAVYFPRVQDIFDEQGDILPELEEKYTSSVVYEFEELIWMAKTLKWGRKNIPERGWE